MLWAFYHEICPGDVILARRGRKSLAAVGNVGLKGFYSEAKNPLLASPGYSHPNFLEVKWHAKPRDKKFPTVVFPMHTLSEITEEQYLKFVEHQGIELPGLEAGDIEDPSEFVLEKYLEDFIVSNFNKIFKGRLEIYEDEEGNSGQQYSTEIGPIDILAFEPSSRSFVVLELKKGRPSDKVIGQALR